MPLSTIHEAKVLLKANTSSQSYLIKQADKRIERITWKLNEKEKLIYKCKEMDYIEKDYLHEVMIDQKLANAFSRKMSVGVEEDKWNHTAGKVSEYAR